MFFFSVNNCTFWDPAVHVTQRQAVHCVLGKMAVTSWVSYDIAHRNVCNNVIVHRVPFNEASKWFQCLQDRKKAHGKAILYKGTVHFWRSCAKLSTNVQPTLRCYSESCLGHVPALRPLVCDALAIVDQHSFTTVAHSIGLCFSQPIENGPIVNYVVYIVSCHHNHRNPGNATGENITIRQSVVP